MNHASLATLSLALLLPGAALATPVLHVDPSLDDCEVHFSAGLTQEAYRRFAREFGSVSAFKLGAPPTVLGRGRVSLDLEQIFFSVDEESAAWNDTFTHPAADHWLGSSKEVPKLRLRAGVTDDLELGVFFTKSPEANYGWLGIEAKYAVFQQGEDAPLSLALRGAYTKTLWVRDMNMHALTADVSIGRTFWRAVTPYLAVGADAILAMETSAAVDLKTEAPFVPHLAAGVEARWWRLAFGVEAQVAALTTVQAQVSVVF